MTFVIKKAKNKSAMYLNVVVYGGYKVGKTRLSLTTGEPTLVISVEDGMLSCAGEDSVDFVELKKHSDIKAFIKDFREDKSGVYAKYKWLFLDTITELGQNLYPPLKEKMDKEAIANGAKGSDGRQVWGKFGEMIGDIVKDMRSLPVNTCILAHPAEKEVDGIEKRTVDVYGKTGARIIGWIDEILYMHLDEDGKEVFLTKSTDRTVAGDRSGKLEKIEPANLGLIRKKILG